MDLEEGGSSESFLLINFLYLEFTLDLYIKGMAFGLFPFSRKEKKSFSPLCSLSPSHLQIYGKYPLVSPVCVLQALSPTDYNFYFMFICKSERLE